MNTIEYSKIDMFFFVRSSKMDLLYCIATTATDPKKLGKGLDGSPLDPSGSHGSPRGVWSFASCTSSPWASPLSA